MHTYTYKVYGVHQYSTSVLNTAAPPTTPPLTLASLTEEDGAAMVRTGTGLPAIVWHSVRCLQNLDTSLRDISFWR